MRSILDAGFVFWGLFLVFGLIVGAYLVWMAWVERTGDSPVPPNPNEKAL
jgi:hypothetical protein